MVIPTLHIHVPQHHPHSKYAAKLLAAIFSMIHECSMAPPWEQNAFTNHTHSTTLTQRPKAIRLLHYLSHHMHVCCTSAMLTCLVLYRADHCCPAAKQLSRDILVLRHPHQVLTTEAHTPTNMISECLQDHVGPLTIPWGTPPCTLAWPCALQGTHSNTHWPTQGCTH